MPILGYGELALTIQGPKGPVVLRLNDVAYCPNFACNIVSLRRLRKRGFFWDDDGRSCIRRRSDKSFICDMFEQHGQFVLEYTPLSVKAGEPDTVMVNTGPAEQTVQSRGDQNNTGPAGQTVQSRGDQNSTGPVEQTVDESRPTEARRHRYNTWTERRPLSGIALTWHNRMGHPGPGALEHIVQASEGVKIRGPTTVECRACGLSKAKRQIRRAPRYPDPSELQKA